VGAEAAAHWEHRPILNLTLFKRRQFAISFMLMFVLGFSLYGTTVLIPQFVQTLLGYTAELAGWCSLRRG
jgi:DHA2 family multidrug resistance protein